MELLNGHSRKEKVVFIIGTTGTGKSKLSIDLAKYFPAEIINSDKIQVHKGLDIITNKVTEVEQDGVPHHLFNVLDPNADFTASDFSRLTLQMLESITKRNRLPIIVGGSNSYIEALVDDEENEFRSKYQFCIIWLYVSLDVLEPSLSKRVDQMVKAGLVDETRKFYVPNADYERGVRRAIGAPEMDFYLKFESSVNEEKRKELLGKALEEIKTNTYKLAGNQLRKIHRLEKLPGWTVHRIDATNVFRGHGSDTKELWEKLVAQPSTLIVKRFLYNDVDMPLPSKPSGPSLSWSLVQF